MLLGLGLTLTAFQESFPRNFLILLFPEITTNWSDHSEQSCSKILVVKYFQNGLLSLTNFIFRLLFSLSIFFWVVSAFAFDVLWASVSCREERIIINIKYPVSKEKWHFAVSYIVWEWVLRCWTLLIFKNSTITEIESQCMCMDRNFPLAGD